MKVVLLCPELFSSEGGIPRILRLYLKALCAEPAHRRIELIALNDRALSKDRLAPYTELKKVVVHACGRSRRAFITATLRATRGASRIVCGHINQLAVARFAKIFHPNLTVYLVAHGTEVWRPHGRLHRWALRGTSRVWCVSDYTRTQLMERCPSLPAERFVVVPNALDPLFQAADFNPPKTARNVFPVFLTVSRLDGRDAYKGVDHLIEAMPLVRRVVPDARLRIVGSGDDTNRLKALVHGLGQDDAVEFTGFVSDDELRREFAACHVFALPSQREGFGLVYLEAFAFGKPCIGARAGGTPEVVDEKSGLLVPYGDPVELASACVEALRRPWDVAAIRARAAEFSYGAFQTHVHRAW